MSQDLGQKVEQKVVHETVQKVDLKDLYVFIDGSCINNFIC